MERLALAKRAHEAEPSDMTTKRTPLGLDSRTVPNAMRHHEAVLLASGIAPARRKQLLMLAAETAAAKIAQWDALGLSYPFGRDHAYRNAFGQALSDAMTSKERRARRAYQHALAEEEEKEGRER